MSSRAAPAGDDDPNDESRGSGTWRVHCDDDEGFAYLEEHSFASDDEGGASDREGGERGADALDASRDSDLESVQFEYETRTGIDVVAEDQQAARRPALHGIQHALRPCSTNAAPLHTQKVGGMDTVCDPVLADTPEQQRVASKCRRGAQVCQSPVG